MFRLLEERPIWRRSLDAGAQIHDTGDNPAEDEARMATRGGMGPDRSEEPHEARMGTQRGMGVVRRGWNQPQPPEIFFFLFLLEAFFFLPCSCVGA